jgi:hypothetical protein
MEASAAALVTSGEDVRGRAGTVVRPSYSGVMALIFWISDSRNALL